MLKKEEELAFFPNITINRYLKLKQKFNNLDEFWSLNQKQLLSTKIWPEKTIINFYFWRKKFISEQIENYLKQNKITIKTFVDSDYPFLLKKIYDPPYALFIQGQLNNKNKIAVIGSRNMSKYGQQITIDLVEQIAKYNLIVVSGLARGIDLTAHLTCLKKQKPTIAVLGSGLDKTNFSQYKNLLIKKIINYQGAVISEYPPFYQANKFSFAKRNRLIAGLSLGVIVIEAKNKSGALITAQYALDSGREIMAVPHNIYNENSTGVNKLIQQGAKLITNFNDILETLNLPQKTKCDNNNYNLKLNSNQQKIIENLNKQPIHIDKLKHLTNLPTNILISEIAFLELNGLIKDLGAKNYILI